ncbi:hypothetical protein PSQ19_10920 [Devosia algicola]|uniref:Uncharacterized protein n=1 Tax=Devosia algicola TaxID=3026418 RepID=A0ABY7YJA1_9HYPH|nr:hypothetical protein [Devosia algicola]WDR01338.1 hypothetical protein PSQ19_10920 [Devosia algicola]
MTTRNILVISDSLHVLPRAVDALVQSGHTVTYLNDNIPFARIASEGLAKARRCRRDCHGTRDGHRRSSA